jgi:hypothetical protein
MKVLKFAFALLVSSVLILGSCDFFDSGSDDDDEGATASLPIRAMTMTTMPPSTLRASTMGMIWDAEETGSANILIDFVQDGESLTGTMYVDNDGDGNFRGDADDNKAGIVATVSGSNITMDVEGGGIDFMTQDVLFWDRPPRLKTSSWTARSRRKAMTARKPTQGCSTCTESGRAKVKGTIVANTFDLSGSLGDLEGSMSCTVSIGTAR